MAEPLLDLSDISHFLCESAWIKARSEQHTSLTVPKFPTASLSPAPLRGTGSPFRLWPELHPAAPLQLQLPFAVKRLTPTRPLSFREAKEPSLDLAADEYSGMDRGPFEPSGSYRAPRLSRVRGEPGEDPERNTHLALRCYGRSLTGPLH